MNLLKIDQLLLQLLATVGITPSDSTSNWFANQTLFCPGMYRDVKDF